MQTEKRPQRKTLVGIVTSAKAMKTLTVRVDRLEKHPVFEKYVKRQSVLYAHDEGRQAHEGDQVEVAETRPLSKTKRWRLVRVLRSGSP
jgi:small subunit ribosomal protein S17